jgi:hypothetical protein
MKRVTLVSRVRGLEFHLLSVVQSRSARIQTETAVSTTIGHGLNGRDFTCMREAIFLSSIACNLTFCLKEPRALPEGKIFHGRN